MPQVAYESKVCSSVALRRFVIDLLAAAGLPQSDAGLVADSLVESNLRGIDSHGVARLPHYLNRIRHGSVNPRPKIKLHKLGPSAARLNADHALGQLAMTRAADEAVKLAKDTGAGWVAVQDSSHCGALASYGLRIADAGMIGLVFTHVDPMVLPFASRMPFCGTNPLCFTAPRAPRGAGELPTGALCLDMATSKTPWNSVANAAMEDVPIPLGWAVDRMGQDTTKADQVGALYPFGEYKGSGLGLMVDILCAMLSDAPFGPDIPKMYGDFTERRHLGGLVGAIDIARFVPLERFHSRMCELISRWTSLPPAAANDRVMFPGEPELREREQRIRLGIPLGLRLLEEFAALARQYRVSPLDVNETAIDAPSALTGPHKQESPAAPPRVTT
jgi:ureidoglycolate dehydrogenase (NAD+)